MKNNSEWYSLENAAKIFPATSNKNDSRVFRFICELKEEIDDIILQSALDNTMNDFPHFYSSLKRGFFWYYLEPIFVKPKVKLEMEYPCSEIYQKKKLLFNVTYFRKRINLEVHHCLTDGTGALIFIKNLIINYLTLRYNINKNLVDIDDSSITEKEDDSFQKYYNHNNFKILATNKNAYRVTGNKYEEDELKIIEGIIPTKDVLQLAKEKDVSVTVLLTAILIESIAKTMKVKDYNKPIVIVVPINLRKHYQSKTIRNFFCTMKIEYKYNAYTKLDDIIVKVKEQFNNNLTNDNLNKLLYKFTNFEHNFLVRIVPLFIKDLVLKFFSFISTKKETTCLSNIGLVKMPENLEKYIENFSFFSSTNTFQLCISSFLDKMTISFSTHLINTEIEKNFFKYFTKKNIKVVINTNHVNEVE